MKELKELDFGGHHYTGNKVNDFQYMIILSVETNAKFQISENLPLRFSSQISTKVIMKMMNKFKLSGMNLSWVSE